MTNFILTRHRARTLATYFAEDGVEGEIRKALLRCWPMPTPLNFRLAESQLQRASDERLARIQVSIERGDLRPY